jgi:drug/metabolite transporter (DMT)-like permease
MLATFWWIEPARIRWTARLIAAVAMTSILCTALAFAVQAWAQKHTTPTRAALIFSMEPVSASITSFLMTGETLSVRALFGAAMMLAAVLAVELKPARAGLHP